MLLLLQSLFIAFLAHATTVSYSAREIIYTYETEFRTLKQEKLTAAETKEQATWHAEHLFGIFQSPDYAKKFGIPEDLNDGHTGTKHLKVLSAKSYSVADDDYVWVKYKAQAKAMVHNEVLKGWLGNKKTAKVSLPLLMDMPMVYTEDGEDYADKKWKKCTDAHYNSAVDFFYFYNPFLCEELGTGPIAHDVELTVELENADGADQALVPTQEIHGDNGNGKLVTLYFALGFDSIPDAGDPKKIHKDVGWKLYASISKDMQEKYGFTKAESEGHLRELLGNDFKKISLLTPTTMENDTQRRYFSSFVKTEGELIYVVRVGLFDTGNEDSSRPLRSFPKFWKEAWENADFLYYGGHSGDGASLSLDTLLKVFPKIEMDKINFRKNKTQIAYIDACSSYAHYKDLYSGKNKSGLHIITHGLVSLFHLAKPNLDTILPAVFQNEKTTWLSLLENVEKKSLLPHLRYLWGKEEGARLAKKYGKKGQYPSSLMNVWVP